MRSRVIAALAFATTAALAQAPQGDAARGKAIYLKEMCSSCHGTAGQGIAYGPRLAPGVFPWDAFQRQLRHPSAVMPRYPENQMSDQDLADVYAYLVSIKPGPSAKDIPLLRE